MDKDTVFERPGATSDPFARTKQQTTQPGDTRGTDRGVDPTRPEKARKGGSK